MPNMKDLEKQIIEDLECGEPIHHDCLTEEMREAAISKAITSKIYANMLIELGFEPPRHYRETFNKEYERRVCALPTEQLEIILRTAVNKQYVRANETINAIEQELAERGLLKESE